VLSGYITTLKISRNSTFRAKALRQELTKGLRSKRRADEGPSLETSSFCLFFKGSNINSAQHFHIGTIPTLVQTVLVYLYISAILAYFTTHEFTQTRAFFKDFPVGGHFLKRGLSVR
jgi:hypothetical protein